MEPDPFSSPLPAVSPSTISPCSLPRASRSVPISMDSASSPVISVPVFSCPEPCPKPMPSELYSSPDPDTPACSPGTPPPSISSRSSNSVPSPSSTSSKSSTISDDSGKSSVSDSSMSSISTSSTSSKISSSSPPSIYSASSSSSAISSTSSSGSSSRTPAVSMEPDPFSSPLPAISPVPEAAFDNSGEPKPTFSDNPLIRSFNRSIFFKPCFFSVPSTIIESDTVSFASFRISIIWSNLSVPSGCKSYPNFLRILSFASSDITKILLDPIFIPSEFSPFS